MSRNMIDFETMLNNVDTGFWVTNSAGEILYTNHPYRQIRQLPKEWFDSHNALQDHSDGITSISPTKVVCEVKQPVCLVQHITGTDGGLSASLFVSCRPVFDNKGEVEYVVGCVVPVDQLNSMYMDALLKNKEYYVKPPRQNTQEPEIDIVAESAEMKALLNMAGQVADSNSTILISGESGAGKNVVAGYIHRNSARRDKGMVEVNCAALPENLLEAELFGYEPGSFTNALSQGKRGLFDEAAGGTLFLNEINSMPLALQGKLLRAIEAKSIRRVGGTKDIPVDFRLITATNANLKEYVDRGLFRSDLYYRLNVIHLRIPPLRERQLDIIPMALNFVADYCREYERAKVLTRPALNKLLDYAWPGNVRELKNVCERIVMMTSRDALKIEELPDTLFDAWEPLEMKTEPISPMPDRIVVVNTPGMPLNINNGTFSLDSYLDMCQASVLEQVLQQTQSTYKTAQLLGVSQSRIARLKKRLNLEY